MVDVCKRSLVSELEKQRFMYKYYRSILCVLLWIFIGLTGCQLLPTAQNQKQTNQTPTAKVEQKGKPEEQQPETTKPKVEPLSPDELKTFKPNEVGVVPILEYHDISRREWSMGRSISNFESDLQRLYEEDYRPITMAEYLENRIDLPAGKSPVIITFDDARKTQIRYLPDGTLDPECAYAIMKDFEEKHPDFKIRAVFYLLPKRLFDQPKWEEKKMKLLLSEGYEFGNHTVTHPPLNRRTDEQVQREFALCLKMMKDKFPEIKMDTVAFPGGTPPNNTSLIEKGSYRGYEYVHKAGFLAIGGPSPAPVSKKLDKWKIVRLLCVEGNQGFDDWFDRMKKGTPVRYVSDGNPLATTVPKKFEKNVDKEKLNGSKLFVY